MKDFIQFTANLLLSLLAQTDSGGDYKMIPFPMALAVCLVGAAVIALIIWLLVIIAINSF